MILALLAACAPSGALWPTHSCRIGQALPLTGDVRCGDAVSGSFVMESVTTVGGDRGADWVGLSWWARGVGADGGDLALGWRPGELGISSSTVGLAAGFVPEGGAPTASVADGCDLAAEGGDVSLTGLPEGWTDDATWRADYATDEVTPVAESWDAPWASTCALDSRGWSVVRVVTACDGQPGASLQYVAPERWSVALDTLGQVDAVEASWAVAFDATCDGVDTAPPGATLVGDDAGLALSTSLVSVARDPVGDWYVTATTCGVCESWTVTVEGLPEF